MFKLFTRISLLAFFIFMGFAAYAEQPAEGPIKIESDKMQYFGEKMMSSFFGHVVVVKEDMKMQADSMDVFFTDTKEVKEIFSKGNVRIEKVDMLALADEARIYQVEQKVVLSGHARVWQGENYLEGGLVTIYLDTNKLFVDKSDESSKRVKIIITPQKETK